jgi:hypothetical protein
MAKKQAPNVVSRGRAKPAGGGEPAAGAKAPAFRLPRDGGGTVGLADFAGRKLVVPGPRFSGFRRIRSRRWTASKPSTS